MRVGAVEAKGTTLQTKEPLFEDDGVLIIAKADWMDASAVDRGEASIRLVGNDFAIWWNFENWTAEGERIAFKVDHPGGQRPVERTLSLPLDPDDPEGIDVIRAGVAELNYDPETMLFSAFVDFNDGFGETEIGDSSSDIDPDTGELKPFDTAGGHRMQLRAWSPGETGITVSWDNVEFSGRSSGDEPLPPPDTVSDNFDDGAIDCIELTAAEGTPTEADGVLKIIAQDGQTQLVRTQRTFPTDGDLEASVDFVDFVGNESGEVSLRAVDPNGQWTVWMNMENWTGDPRSAFKVDSPPGSRPVEATFLTPRTTGGLKITYDAETQTFAGFFNNGDCDVLLGNTSRVEGMDVSAGVIFELRGWAPGAPMEISFDNFQYGAPIPPPPPPPEPVETLSDTFDGTEFDAEIWQDIGQDPMQIVDGAALVAGINARSSMVRTIHPLVSAGEDINLEADFFDFFALDRGESSMRLASNPICEWTAWLNTENWTAEGERIALKLDHPCGNRPIERTLSLPLDPDDPEGVEVLRGGHMRMTYQADTGFIEAGVDFNDGFGETIVGDTSGDIDADTGEHRPVDLEEGVFVELRGWSNGETDGIRVSLDNLMATGGDPIPPGVGKFLRGDCDGNGTVELTDTVFFLNATFLGGPTPGCRAACDTDGDGALDVTTAVYSLNYLFQGGARPADPWPCSARSERPGDIALGCETPHSTDC